jgi:NADH-quinone oxidoreductase subunit M
VPLFDSHLLTWILFSPAIGAVLILLLPADRPRLLRWAAFIFSLVPLALSVYLWLRYDPAQAGYQFVEQYAWYSAVASSYHVGVDGISVPMVLLTTLLTPLALLISWSVEERVRAYMALFLFLETGMLGVFVSLDLLLFFVFWEIGLVPMYFLINQWGSANRNYASFKFLIITMAGSLGLLLAIQLIGLSVGTFDLTVITSVWPTFVSSLGSPACRSTSVETVKTIAPGRCHRFRHQGAGLAVPHLAARRPHRGPHRRLDDPGRSPAEARRLRVPALGAAAIS